MRPLLIALACAALALPACGGDNGKPIPRSDRKQIDRLLTEARNRLDPLRCNDLRVSDPDGTATLTDLLNHVDSLPENVDTDVRDALKDSIFHLRDLIDDKCNKEPKPETTPTETTPTETTPTETETTPTETTPTETTPTETTPTEPDNGGGGQPGPGDQGKKKGHKKGKGARR